MTFLQPLLLFGLPLIAIPIIIHLLNKRRHRTIQWAAMQFLLKATRQAKGNRRLRHFLILACRVLALAALLFALSRPMTGGWLGGLGGNAPDTVLLLLDRSASMEQQDPDTGISKRASAIEKLAKAAGKVESSRMVVIDSATLKAQEISSPEMLVDIANTAPTDTAADIPSMLEAGLDYIVSNQSGKTEVWLASDLQASGWKNESPRWEALRGGFSELKQSVRIRLLALTADPKDNAAIEIENVTRQKTAEGNELVVNLRLLRSGDGEAAKIPLAVVLEGARQRVNMDVDGADLRFQQRINLGDRADSGWGWIELPNDTNVRDNRAFFAFSETLPQKSVIVSDAQSITGQILNVAAAPAPDKLNQSASMIKAKDLSAVPWDELALICWQESLPLGPAASSLETFVETGGMVICFPPGKASGNGNLLGTTWGEVEQAPEDAPYKISDWQNDDGPLAAGHGGEDLALESLEIKRRQPILGGKNNVVLATFADGKPFLVRRQLERGAIYYCASIPEIEWSNLGDGSVLVPMIQRILADGSRRLGSAMMAESGELLPFDLEQRESWKRLDEAANSTVGNERVESGIYQVGPRVVATNRPLEEDSWQVMDEESIAPLFGELSYSIFEQRAQEKKSDLANEIWKIFLIGMLIFLIGEALLCMPPKSKMDAEEVLS